MFLLLLQGQITLLDIPVYKAIQPDVSCVLLLVVLYYNLTTK